MADSGVFRLPPLSGWQREAVMAAAAFLREQHGNPPADARARTVYEGLLEVLDPPRRAARIQREMSDSARKAALTAKTERRTGRERRTGADRRKENLGPPPGTAERRRGDRRRAGERRGRR
ncbi:MAG: hypothetical protein AB1635_12295 [Acidobacteriota bacterium]